MSVSLMTKQITLEEALKLVTFYHSQWGWRIRHVNSDVFGSVAGNVYGLIKGREWTFVETPKKKLQRLLDGASEEELLKLINQMENN